MRDAEDVPRIPWLWGELNRLTLAHPNHAGALSDARRELERRREGQGLSGRTRIEDAGLGLGRSGQL